MPKVGGLKKIQNPHDKFFKETFSNVEVARDFIENYLPESILKIIDLETLELQKDCFITGSLFRYAFLSHNQQKGRVCLLSL